MRVETDDTPSSSSSGICDVADQLRFFVVSAVRARFFCDACSRFDDGFLRLCDDDLDAEDELDVEDELDAEDEMDADDELEARCISDCASTNVFDLYS